MYFNIFIRHYTTDGRKKKINKLHDVHMDKNAVAENIFDAQNKL